MPNTPLALDAETEPPRSPGEGRRVLRELRRRITGGALPPGAQLHEHALATAIGVSRSRIREAIAQMEASGLIERIPNRGAFVRRPTLQEMRDIFEAREALEGMSARLAAGRTQPEEWQDLVTLFGAPVAALVDDGDLEAYIEHVAQLRRRIVAASGNRAIAQALQPLLDRSALTMQRVVLATNRAEEALGQHRAVLAALRNGDGEAAERLKRLQVRAAWEILERYHRLVL